MDLAEGERPKLLSSSSTSARTKDQTVGKFLSVSIYPNAYLNSRFSKVYFVNASSVSTINADLSSIALVEGIGDTHQDTADWLCGLREEWLLIFDNADDIQLNIQDYFPPCSHGNVIITTRNVNLCIHAEDSSCDTTRLSPTDALDLFQRVARLSSQDEGTKKLAASFVKVHRLWHLHASRPISRNQHRT